MRPESVFRIASITKTFTAVAVMKLVEDGLLRLDDHVSDYLPQFAGRPFDKIKIWHLLTHTSGLYPDDGCYNFTHFVSPWEHIVNKWKENGADTDWIAAGLSNGLRGKVGEKWQYSTFGFELIGAVIEKVIAGRAADYITDHIITPLNLSDTAFVMTKDMAKRAAYNNEWLEREVKDALDPPEHREPEVWDRIPQTGSGIFSTAFDLVKYGDMLRGNGRRGDVRVLGRKGVEKLRTNALKGVPDHCWGHEYEDRWYGFGFDMLSANDCITTPGHYFHEGSGGCALVIDPAEDMVAAWSALYSEFQPSALYNAQNIMWSGLL
jgi:CubicO group peptidase (beta-lactamase class C family)